MSTEFTIYALDEAGCELARRYMGTSIGYGRPIHEVLDNAARAQSGDIARQLELSGYAVFDAPSLILDAEHTTMGEGCGTGECVAHVISSLIGPNLPVIDRPLMGKLMAAIPDDWGGGQREYPEAHPRRLNTFPAAEAAVAVDQKGKPVPQARKLSPRVFRAQLIGWLEGARGRRLWWCYS